LFTRHEADDREDDEAGEQARAAVQYGNEDGVPGHAQTTRDKKNTKIIKKGIYSCVLL